MKGLITNEWDRDNLNFLLNTGDKELEVWHAQADADDLAYAQELLAAYSLELKVRAEELKIEGELALGNNQEAIMVIDKILKR
jgi:hypothetical protein